MTFSGDFISAHFGDYKTHLILAFIYFMTKFINDRKIGHIQSFQIKRL